MHQKKQLVSRKHVAKRISPEQEKEIKQVQDNMTKNRGGERVAWIEAKHEYFEREERQAEYAPGEKPPTNKILSEEELALIPKTKPSKAEYNVVKKKSVMTIAETKLGVTMVLSKEECIKLGIKETETTKDAIQEIRKRLGLPEKKKRGE